MTVQKMSVVTPCLNKEENVGIRRSSSYSEVDTKARVSGS